MNDYIKKYHDILDNIDINNKPTLFMHVCCAPCSSHILIKLIKYFNIYIIFYNPNIDTKEEYDKRLENLNIFLEKNGLNNIINIIYKNYEPDIFYENTKGHEEDKEGTDRCKICIKLRLEESIKIAKKYIDENNIKGDIYFVTSLSTSPHKNAEYICETGLKLLDNNDIKYLISDFKKEDGYLDSIKLSKKYNIYRQEYCGCVYSKGQ